MPTRRFGRDRVAQPEVWLGSGGQPEGSEGVGRLTRRSGRDWEAHPEVQEGLEGPPGGPGGVV